MPTEEVLALEDEGRLDDARAACERAVAEHYDDLDVLADAADFFVRNAETADDNREWLERGLVLARRAQKLARREHAEDALLDMQVLEARALNDAGENRDALRAADAVLGYHPDAPDALLERGTALYELCRFDEARTALSKAVEVAPDDPWSHRMLALVAERLGDEEEAKRRFARVQRLAPEFEEPVHMRADEFDRLVEAALEDIPESVSRWLSNVPITVEELPALEDLTASDPPLSPSSLGMFRGAPFGEKASMDPWSHFPSSIVLYQRNLERFAKDKDELAREIGVTLVHEVGHYLGLDEDELWERGLD